MSAVKTKAVNEMFPQILHFCLDFCITWHRICLCQILDLLPGENSTLFASVYTFIAYFPYLFYPFGQILAGAVKDVGSAATHLLGWRVRIAPWA